MATRHYVTDSGGGGWKGTDASVPGAKGCREDTGYSADEKTYVSDANDATYVDQTGDWEPAAYPGHEYDVPAPESGITQLDIVARCGDPADQNTHCLYIYNFNASAYVLLKSDSGPAVPYTLSGSITSNISNYISGGKVRLQVAQPDAAGQLCRVHDIYVDVTWSELQLSAADLAHGQSLEGATIVQQHTLSPADLGHAHNLALAVLPIVAAALAHTHALEATTLTEIVSTFSPANLAHGHSLQTSALVQQHTLAPADLAQAHGLDVTTITVADVELNPADLSHGHSLEAATILQQQVLSPADLAHGHALQSPEFCPEVYLYLSVLPGGRRRVFWNEPGTVYLVVDGTIYARSSDGYVDFPAAFTVRSVLVAYQVPPSSLPTPRDEVDLTISGDPGVLHHIERQPDGGDWARIASIAASTHTDGPLADALYHYRAVDEDDQGDTATSATQDVTISSAPDPPSDLAWTWDGELKKLTLTWTASPSNDVASYRVRSSAGEEWLDLTSAPVQDSADLSYEQVFTNETGLYVFSVRAIDSDGNEEANLTQIVAVAISEGVQTATPAAPRAVEAMPIAGGKVQVSWLYEPADEENGPGAAFEARIYYDNGTGTVDYATPLGTVAMGNPTAVDRYTWDSGVLVDEQEYLFVVRIATAAHPAGIENQNTDEHAATPDSDIPSTPVLTAQVA